MTTPEEKPKKHKTIMSEVIESTIKNDKDHSISNPEELLRDVEESETIYLSRISNGLKLIKGKFQTK